MQCLKVVGAICRSTIQIATLRMIRRNNYGALHERVGSCQWTCLPPYCCHLQHRATFTFKPYVFIRLLLARHNTQQLSIKREEIQCNVILLERKKKTNTVTSQSRINLILPHFVNFCHWQPGLFFGKPLSPLYALISLSNPSFHSFSRTPWRPPCLYFPASFCLPTTLHFSFLKSGGKSICSLLLDLVKYISCYMYFLALTLVSFEGDRTKLRYRNSSH